MGGIEIPESFSETIEEVFSGKLGFLDLAELIQLIGNNGFSGVLKLQIERSDEIGSIYFINGNPVDADAGSLNGLDAIYALFGWRTGKFTFSEGRTSRKKIIHKNRMEILLDGMRMVDDGTIKTVSAKSLSSAEYISALQAGKMPEVKGPQIDYIYVVEEESFQDGEIIAEEGKHGGWLWVILEGTVDIVKKVESGDMLVLRLAEGAFVGSFASFLPGDHVRSAAAVARGSVQLGVLDSPRLAGEFAALSPTFRRFLISVDHRLKEVTNRLIDIRSKKMGLLELPKDMEPFPFEAERKGKLFLINRGKLNIVRHTEHGHILLAALGPGDSFGNIPFLDMGHEPFSASAYASKDIEIQAMDEKGLQEEYHRQGATLKNLLEHVSDSISITTQLLFNAFLKGKGEETVQD